MNLTKTLHTFLALERRFHDRELLTYLLDLAHRAIETGWVNLSHKLDSLQTFETNHNVAFSRNGKRES